MASRPPPQSSCAQVSVFHVDTGKLQRLCATEYESNSTLRHDGFPRPTLEAAENNRRKRRERDTRLDRAHRPPLRGGGCRKHALERRGKRRLASRRGLKTPHVRRNRGAIVAPLPCGRRLSSRAPHVGQLAALIKTT